MKRLTLISIILICGLICTACQTIENNQSSENSTENTSSSDTSLEDEDINTSIITDTSTIIDQTTVETSSISNEETIEDTKETSETSDINTTIEDITTNATTDETITTNDTINSYNDFKIPIKSNSEHITESMCREISEYFNSMTQVDVDTFKSKQLSAYNTYMEEYLIGNGSNFESMLNTYNSNYLISSGSDEGVYTSYTIDNISLDYPNDVDSILNTMNYINQLDDITEQYEDYAISQQLTAYYQLNYTIDYTLQGDQVENFNGTKTGSILVLDMSEQLYLIMLY